MQDQSALYLVLLIDTSIKIQRTVPRERAVHHHHHALDLDVIQPKGEPRYGALCRNALPRNGVLLQVPRHFSSFQRQSLFPQRLGRFTTVILRSPQRVSRLARNKEDAAASEIDKEQGGYHACGPSLDAVQSAGWPCLPLSRQIPPRITTAPPVSVQKCNPLCLIERQRLPRQGTWNSTTFGLKLLAHLVGYRVHLRSIQDAAHPQVLAQSQTHLLTLAPHTIIMLRQSALLGLTWVAATLAQDANLAPPVPEDAQIGALHFPITCLILGSLNQTFDVDFTGTAPAYGGSGQEVYFSDTAGVIQIPDALLQYARNLNATYASSNFSVNINVTNATPQTLMAFSAVENITFPATGGTSLRFPPGNGTLAPAGPFTLGEPNVVSRIQLGNTYVSMVLYNATGHAVSGPIDVVRTYPRRKCLLIRAVRNHTDLSTGLWETKHRVHPRIGQRGQLDWRPTSFTFKRIRAILPSCSAQLRVWLLSVPLSL